jgi:hypothetical protein
MKRYGCYAMPMVEKEERNGKKMALWCIQTMVCIETMFGCVKINFV